MIAQQNVLWRGINWASASFDFNVSFNGN